MRIFGYLISNLPREMSIMKGRLYSKSVVERITVSSTFALTVSLN